MEARTIYENDRNMNDDLKAQIIDCIEYTYLNDLLNRYTAYLGINTSKIITHMMMRYELITLSDLEAFNKCMIKPIDQAQPIDALFKRINNDVQCATDGDNAYTANQVVQTGYHAILSTG